MAESTNLDTIRLVPIEETDCTDEAIWEMLQDIGACENGFNNPAYGLSFEEFGEFILGRVSWRHGLGLKGGRVPETWYWVRAGSMVLGVVKLRHRLNEVLRSRGGHIGMAIRASARGRGHGSAALALALKEAARLGIREVLLTCEESYPASRRMIEKNGGVLADVIDSRLIFVVQTPEP